MENQGPGHKSCLFLWEKLQTYPLLFSDNDSDKEHNKEGKEKVNEVEDYPLGLKT